jgi:hypothetical protein
VRCAPIRSVPSFADDLCSGAEIRPCKAVRYALNHASRQPRLPHTLSGRGRSSGVEHNLAKVGVVSSNLIARSNLLQKNKGFWRRQRRARIPGERVGERGHKKGPWHRPRPGVKFQSERQERARTQDETRLFPSWDTSASATRHARRDRSARGCMHAQRSCAATPMQNGCFGADVVRILNMLPERWLTTGPNPDTPPQTRRRCRLYRALCTSGRYTSLRRDVGSSLVRDDMINA